MKPHKPTSALSVMKVLTLVVITGIFFFACKNNDTTTTPSTTTTTTTPEQNQPPCTAGKLYMLQLSSADYLALKTAAGPAHTANLVVQFIYNNANPNPLSLIAYAARPGHKFQANPPNPAHPLVWKELIAVSEAPGPFPAKYVLGDQQISIGLVDALLAGAGNPANYTLTFTPEVNGANNNIRFKICVINPTWCPNAGTYTQPSPPANAD